MTANFSSIPPPLRLMRIENVWCEVLTEPLVLGMHLDIFYWYYVCRINWSLFSTEWFGTKGPGSPSFGLQQEKESHTLLVKISLSMGTFKLIQANVSRIVALKCAREGDGDSSIESKMLFLKIFRLWLSKKFTKATVQIDFCFKQTNYILNLYFWCMIK